MTFYYYRSSKGKQKFSKCYQQWSWNSYI